MPQDQIPFEIVFWGEGTMCDGKGMWNYYVFLSERQIGNLSLFYRKAELKEFFPGGTKYLSYDEDCSPLSKVYWHGGVTFWEQTDLPYKLIKIGCDYGHLWDQERGYNFTLEDVTSDCLRTIEELSTLLTILP